MEEEIDYIDGNKSVQSAMLEAQQGSFKNKSSLTTIVIDLVFVRNSKMENQNQYNFQCSFTVHKDWLPATSGWGAYCWVLCT